MRLHIFAMLMIWGGYLSAQTSANHALAAEAELITLADLQLGSEWIQHRVVVPEAELSCFQRPGEGATLLLIPGTFSDSRIFALTVRHLNPKLNLIIIENRGLGGSWPPPEKSSIERCAEDALAVMDALKVDLFYASGHSLGGMIALELGQREPDRVQGIVSIEGWTTASAAALAFQGDMKSTLSPAQLDILAAYRKDVLRRWSDEQIKMFGSIWRQWDGSAFLDATTLPILELYGMHRAIHLLNVFQADGGPCVRYQSDRG